MQSDESKSTSSTLSTIAIQSIVDKLKVQWHRSTTKKNYYSIWRSFNEFFIQLDVKPPTWEDRLILFVAYLVDSKKQSSTIKSYMSAVKAVLQDDGHYLNVDKMCLNSMTKACRLQNDRVHSRLPICKGLLHLILKGLETVFDSPQPF